MYRELRKPFAADEVKQRQGPGGKALDYVPIETILGRLLDVAPGFRWEAGVDLRMTPDTKYLAIAQGTLTIGEGVGTGVGAMIHGDPDMASKTALSEAIKNAAKNGFGVGLELWSEEHRASLATDRALAAGDEATLKKVVYDRAKDGLGKSRPTQAEVADYFNVTVDDLKSADVLKGILGL
jgi:hypothetical protein